MHVVCVIGYGDVMGAKLNTHEKAADNGTTRNWQTYDDTNKYSWTSQ